MGRDVQLPTLCLKMSFSLEEYTRKYAVHVETLTLIKNTPPSKWNDVETAVSRYSLEGGESLAGKVEIDGSETELIVPSDAVKASIVILEFNERPFQVQQLLDGIPVTVYKPKQCHNIKAPSILLYIHGGGNVVGGRKTHETVCKILARDSPCIVVNIEYRLAPEHKFPANQEDVNCVIEWLVKNKSVIGGSAKSKLGVCGDSAGGKLAAVACHEEKEHVNFAILVYPSVNYTGQYPSQEEFQYDPVLPKDLRAWFTSQYITEKDMSSPRASVILHKEFSYLPPTLIILAELDPLRDGGFAYYEKLKAAGVKVECKMIKGVPHGFWAWPASFPKTCHEAHKAATDFIHCL